MHNRSYSFNDLSKKVSAMKNSLNKIQLKDLLLQMMETELGGEQVYRTAISCAVNRDLANEWKSYLDETLSHQEIVKKTCEHLGIDPMEESASRSVVKHIGQSLLQAMKLAKSSGDATAAQLVACECVVYAETKDHANWELLGKVAQVAKSGDAEVLKKAHEAVEEEEDHHLYHTKGWCRELWIESLGMSAVLPPPEEIKKVETAIGASRAEQSREKYLN